MAIYVDFIQKQPDHITATDKWVRAECNSMYHAESVEAAFHAVGWCARIVIVQMMERFPAGMKRRSTTPKEPTP